MGKKEILSGIYMITNPIGQMYIGQSIDIQKRFNHYKKNGEMNHRLNDSIKEYGIDNHKFVVLEYCHIKKLNN